MSMYSLKRIGYIAVVAVSALATAVFGGDYRISGKTTQLPSGEPLAKSAVSVVDSKGDTLEQKLSNPNGEFEFNIETGVAKNDQIPEGFSVADNYPNPFNKSTILAVNSMDGVSVDIYNALGQLVMEKRAGPGERNISFDFSDHAAGTYFAVVGNGVEFDKQKLLYLPNSMQSESGIVSADAGTLYKPSFDDVLKVVASKDGFFPDSVVGVKDGDNLELRLIEHPSVSFDPLEVGEDSLRVGAMIEGYGEAEVYGYLEKDGQSVIGIGPFNWSLPKASEIAVPADTLDSFASGRYTGYLKIVQNGKEFIENHPDTLEVDNYVDVNGRALLPDSTGVGGLEVMVLQDDDIVAESETDSSGRVSFSLDPGVYKFLLRGDDGEFKRYSKEVEISESSELVFNIFRNLMYDNVNIGEGERVAYADNYGENVIDGEPLNLSEQESEDGIFQDGPFIVAGNRAVGSYGVDFRLLGRNGSVDTVRGVVDVDKMVNVLGQCFGASPDTLDKLLGAWVRFGGKEVIADSDGRYQFNFSFGVDDTLFIDADGYSQRSQIIKVSDDTTMKNYSIDDVLPIDFFNYVAVSSAPDGGLKKPSSDFGGELGFYIKGEFPDERYREIITSAIEDTFNTLYKGHYKGFITDDSTSAWASVEFKNRAAYAGAVSFEHDSNDYTTLKGAEIKILKGMHPIVVGATANKEILNIFDIGDIIPQNIDINKIPEEWKYSDYYQGSDYPSDKPLDGRIQDIDENLYRICLFLPQDYRINAEHKTINDYR